MHLFHCPDLASDAVELPPEEAHHALAVLRLRAGDRVGLLDGRGTKALGELIGLAKRSVTARVLERRLLPPERAARIQLAVAPTKQMERFEWFVEKAVEVGVDRIIPIRTERTERSALRHDRLLRVAVAAMKQSQRAWLPEIAPLMPLEALLTDAPAQRFFGWCQPGLRSLMAAYRADGDALLAIGPEGDFTEAEAERLRGAGAEGVALGAARLRTETAALAACTWMSLSQQR